MRRVHLALLLLAVPGATGAAPALPALQLFADGFRAGTWEVTSEGSTGQRRPLADPGAMVFAGQTLADDCRVTVVDDRTTHAVVTWRCPGGDSGRSHVRRDHGGLYVVQAQGISGRRPFAAQAEYRFVGP